MEYPKRPKPLFKRSRKLPLYYRYPKTFYFGCLSGSMLILFSRIIYDVIFRPPTVDPLTLTPEERRKIVLRSTRIWNKEDLPPREES